MKRGSPTPHARAAHVKREPRALTSVGGVWLSAYVCVWCGSVGAVERCEIEFVREQQRVGHYAVEIAATDEARRAGLMGRTEMAVGQGMLFDFGRARPLTMWMQNTVLSLDMVFVQEGGTVSDIVAATIPLSTALITPRTPVRYVIELNAGEAARLKLHDRLTITTPSTACASVGIPLTN